MWCVIVTIPYNTILKWKIFNLALLDHCILVMFANFNISCMHINVSSEGLYVFHFGLSSTVQGLYRGSIRLMLFHRINLPVNARAFENLPFKLQ